MLRNVLDIHTNFIINLCNTPYVLKVSFDSIIVCYTCISGRYNDNAIYIIAVACGEGLIQQSSSHLKWNPADVMKKLLHIFS